MNISTIQLKKAGLFVAASALLAGTLGLAGVWSGGAAQAAPAGLGYFLKLDGILGESTDVKHKGEIDLTSFAWSKEGTPGIELPASAAGGGGTVRAEVHDIFLKQNVSKASPLLMKASATGQHFDTVTLTVDRKTAKATNDYLTIKLSDAVVTSYRLVGNDANAPSDEFSLNFAKIEYSYVPQKANGTADTPVAASFDFRTNTNL